eukprot:GHVN01105892.1.p1 GENE.GHVN01105892.1~~GHVN01105892.1.p1  ORF type:complete len:488 (-),score=38.22 GHVN01105892.1:511-1974(-)
MQDDLPRTGERVRGRDRTDYSESEETPRRRARVTMSDGIGTRDDVRSGLQFPGSLAGKNTTKVKESFEKWFLENQAGMGETSVHQLFEAQQLSHENDPTYSVVTCLLLSKVFAVQSAYEVSSKVLALNDAVKFFKTCNIAHLKRYCPLAFLQVASGAVQTAIEAGVSGKLILSMRFLLDSIANGKTGLLTSLHKLYLDLCVEGGFYSQSAKILSEQRFQLDKKLLLKETDVRDYFFQAGLVCLEFNWWTTAERYFAWSLLFEQLLPAFRVSMSKNYSHKLFCLAVLRYHPLVDPRNTARIDIKNIWRGILSRWALTDVHEITRRDEEAMRQFAEDLLRCEKNATFEHQLAPEVGRLAELCQQTAIGRQFLTRVARLYCHIGWERAWDMMKDVVLTETDFVSLLLHLHSTGVWKGVVDQKKGTIQVNSCVSSEGLTHDPQQPIKTQATSFESLVELSLCMSKLKSAHLQESTHHRSKHRERIAQLGLL